MKLLVLLLLTQTLFAQTLPDAEMTYILVDKNLKTATLYTLPEDIQQQTVIKKYQIALGKELGDKFFEGDNKTPEGIYLVEPSRKITDPQKREEKFGPYAIPMDYPNPMDLIAKKTGYGIWMHGAGQNSRIEKVNVTEGCVAFYNWAIEEVINWIKPQHSIAVIAQNEQEVNTLEDWKQVRLNTQKWLEAWASKDLENYVGSYDQDFKFNGMNISGFKKYKKHLFDRYTKMIVKMDTIRVIVHPKYAMSLMNQNFIGNSIFKSTGRKILYWTKNQEGQWKIRHERFERNYFSQLPLKNIPIQSSSK